MRIAPHLLNTSTPPISAAYDSASAFLKAHPDKPLLDCAQGSPSSPPPDFLLKALSTESCDPKLAFRYGLNGGEAPLQSALAAEIVRRRGAVDVTHEDIAITSGCNLAFFAAGDEVIIPSPWYFNHQMALTMLGIKPVPLIASPSQGFVPNPSDVPSLLSDRTRAIVLVSPNNPTGAIYPPDTLTEFFKIAEKHNLVLFLDETYRDFIGARPHSLFSRQLGANWRNTLIHLFSFSKSYAIPGARLGAVVADPTFITHLNKSLDTIQICPPRAPQHALASVFTRYRPFIEQTALELRERQEAFRAALPSSWRLASAGGYFAFVSHPYNVTASEVCRYLASQHGCFGYSAPTTQGQRIADEQRWIRASVAAVTVAQMNDLRIALLAADKYFAN
ncbi:PLP-dependent transferase [Auriculariales sp. MPI-PUGE-AT-0066]|nr:PLP-dependent transferase [Auriculariales sp. MPI-PUGE-AT-0066]